jgi:hypothetical protein
MSDTVHFHTFTYAFLGRSDVTGDKSETFPRILSRNISLYSFVDIIPFRVSSGFLFLSHFDTFNTSYTKNNESNMKDPSAMGQEFIYPGIMDLQDALFLKLRLIIFYTGHHAV